MTCPVGGDVSMWLVVGMYPLMCDLRMVLAHWVSSWESCQVLTHIVLEASSCMRTAFIRTNKHTYIQLERKESQTCPYSDLLMVQILVQP